MTTEELRISELNAAKKVRDYHLTRVEAQDELIESLSKRTVSEGWSLNTAQGKKLGGGSFDVKRTTTPGCEHMGHLDIWFILRITERGVSTHLDAHRALDGISKTSSGRIALK